MNFHKNLRNLREKVKNFYGLTYKMACISAVKSPIVLKMVSNGFYGNIKPSLTTIFELFDILFEEYYHNFLNLVKKYRKIMGVYVEKRAYLGY